MLRPLPMVWTYCRLTHTRVLWVWTYCCAPYFTLLSVSTLPAFFIDSLIHIGCVKWRLSCQYSELFEDESLDLCDLWWLRAKRNQVQSSIILDIDRGCCCCCWRWMLDVVDCVVNMWCSVCRRRQRRRDNCDVERRMRKDRRQQRTRTYVVCVYVCVYQSPHSSWCCFCAACSRRKRKKQVRRWMTRPYARTTEEETELMRYYRRRRNRDVHVVFLHVTDMTQWNESNRIDSTRLKFW